MGLQAGRGDRRAHHACFARRAERTCRKLQRRQGVRRVGIRVRLLPISLYLPLLKVSFSVS